MKTLIKNELIGYEVLIDEPYKDRPMFVIFPGGGYHHLSTREAEPVAEKFLSFGYNVTIVKYSVAPHADFIQLKQGLEVVELLSKTYDKIVVCGFSAGGHLAGLVATEKAKNNIKAMILCYPVITLCDKTHLGTRTNLLANGNDTLENRIKIYCYISVCGLLWSNWCEYKRTLGVEFGEYAIKQYWYAKHYCSLAIKEIQKIGKASV